MEGIVYLVTYIPAYFLHRNRGNPAVMYFEEKRRQILVGFVASLALFCFFKSALFLYITQHSGLSIAAIGCVQNLDF